MGNEIVIQQIKISFVLFFLLLFSFQINPQSYLITKYSTDNGLPDNRVNDIAQDSLGRIWIAMASGIAMYDGYEWTKFGEKDGVPEVEYTKIKVDEKGIIWFLPKHLLESALVFFKLNKWEVFSLKSKFNKVNSYSNAFEIFYKNNQINILVSMGHIGVYVFKNYEWSVLNSKNGLLCDSVSTILYVKNRIFISTSKGMSVLDDSFNFITSGYNQILPTKNILGLSKFTINQENSDSLLIIGDNWFGAISNDNHFHNILYHQLPFIAVGVTTFTLYHNNNCIYFGNSAAVYQYNLINNVLTKIILEQPNSDRGGTSCLIDYEGNIWISSLRGIYKLNLVPFLNINKDNGLLENEVSAISEFSNGSYVFGHNYGFSIKTKNIFIHVGLYKKVDQPKIMRVMNIVHSNKNDLNYFSSYQNGIGHINYKGKIDWIQKSSTNNFNYVFLDKDNVVNFNFNRRLITLPNNRKSQKLFKVRSLIRDHLIYDQKTIFLALQQFVIRIKDDSLTFFKTYYNEANDFFSVCNLNGLGLLFGSAKGLYRFENDSLIKFNFNEQDITDPIYFIIQDSSKNIWLGTNNGVLKWDGKYLKRYNKSDGLAGNETNRAAGFVDSKGNVWIGTDEGVSMYTGNEPDYFKFPPKVLLLNFHDHTNQSYNISKTVDVGPNNNNLIFNFRGLSFIDEKRNLFQIKLIEVNGDYQNEFTTKSTSARFNNLAPGDYIFSVRVQNSKGVWSEWKNSSLITVQDHFYNEPLFYLSVFGLLLFAAFTLNDYYQQKKYTKKLEKAVDERTQDLQATQKELLTTANRYKGIIESQTDLVIRITETGILTFVNDAYCAVFGKNPEDLLGKSFVPFVHPDDIDPTFEEIKKLRYPPYRSTIEQRDLTIDGYRWFSWEGYAILDKGGNVLEIQAVGRDITIQKEVEIELEKRVNQRTIELQSLISQSPLGILTFDSLGRMMTYNNVANDLFGSLKEYVMPSSDFNLLEDQFLMKNNYLESLKTLDSPNSFLLTNPILIDDLNNRIYKNLYNHFLVYRIYNIMLDEKNITYVLMLEDVTEQQMSEEVSKKLLEEKIRISTIIKTIESERDRVAKELHDGLGQLLTTAKIKLDIIKLKTDKDLKEIDDTVNVLINAGDEIRRIINDLKPSDVESFGLISSIELLVERVRQSSGIKILLSVLSNIQFPDKNMELIIYRIIQEALNNTIKHSHCNKASIELLTINNELQIHIGDDGVGFDFSMFSEKFKSYGINNIKERVNSLNGKVEIETEPGKGFKYHIRIPL